MNYEIKLDINIKAPIEVVWKELVNFEVYNSWNPVFASIIGDFKVNSKLKIKLKNDMKLKALLLEINEEKSFKWLMTIGPKFLFNSIHSFELEKIDENTTKFIQTETFAGMGVKKFWKKMKLATEQGYDYMNMALKYRCENLMKK
ncbi:SRPBCC domain-containing protein [Spiroplasma endosymbiont of Diplazon laetatorius]|uniref:SRPBCC domain-containing protein n=1 Tax=Spiroplasma endosymbiont of Diplazon laetatorius TaxID=3066322 RepID=UPI0030D5988D